MRIVILVLIILVGVIIPAGLIQLGAGKTNAQSVLALTAGSVAFSLMSINIFLATRPRGLEAAIGGLDRLYQVHKWIGIAIIPLILIHDVVGMDIEGQIVAQGLARTAAEVAEIAFPILLVLILLSWIKRIPKMRRDLIPYHIWRWSHRVIGVVFLMLFFHQLFVKVPFDANASAAQYLNGLGIIGVLSFLYTQFLAPLRPRSYVVTGVEAHPAATIISAMPARGKGLHPRAGAFAIISFGKKGLREPHPFTVSQIGQNGALQFSIRGLGDYTRRVRDLVAVDDKMRVEGPYGQFSFRKGPASQVWLAGGIGVTPFLAFADSLTAEDTQQVCMIYCVNKRDEAVGLDRLDAAAARCPGFSYRLFVSEDSGRLDAGKLVENLTVDMTQSGLWFCGPAPMREAILGGLKAAGKEPKKVYFEEFEFR